MRLRALIESLERDSSLRQRARRFADELRDSVVSKARASKDGTFYLYASDFSTDSELVGSGLIVVLAPSNAGIKAGVGTYKGRPAVVFYSLLEPGNLKYIETRLNQSTIEHEVIHLMDAGRGKSKVSPSRIGSGDASDSDYETYYNSDAEWNAYFQEGAAGVERTLANLRAGDDDWNKKVVRNLLGDGTFASFLKVAVKNYWDADFLKHMDSRIRRKFEKRLGVLWQGLEFPGKK